jgi:hypothetical protein
LNLVVTLFMVLGWHSGWNLDPAITDALRSAADEAGDQKLAHQVCFLSAVHGISRLLASVASWDGESLPKELVKSFRGQAKAFKEFLTAVSATLPSLFSKSTDPCHCDMLDGWCNGAALAKALELEIAQAHALFVTAWSVYIKRTTDNLISWSPNWQLAMPQLLEHTEVVKEHTVFVCGCVFVCVCVCVRVERLNPGIQISWILYGVCLAVLGPLWVSWRVGLKAKTWPRTRAFTPQDISQVYLQHP